MGSCSTLDELERRFAALAASPRDEGRLELIVRRPESGQREIVHQAELDCDKGLIGDNWLRRGSRHTADGSSHPDMQLNLMNSRVIELIAGEKERWALAGDQLFIDLDLSPENLPVGQRLAVGLAVIEVTEPPHTGCGKFVKRFGVDAMKFVNSPQGRQRNLRGINARVVTSGTIETGQTVRKLTI